MLTSHSLLPLDGFHLSRRQYISHLNFVSLLAGNMYSLSPFLVLREQFGAPQPTISNQVGYYWYVKQIFSINLINSLVMPPT